MSETPKSDAAMRHLPRFFSRVSQRMENGKRDYGDCSYDRPFLELIDEIQQELEDVCGWSSIMWTRLEMMRTELSNGVVFPQDK